MKAKTTWSVCVMAIEHPGQPTVPCLVIADHENKRTICSISPIEWVTPVDVINAQEICAAHNGEEAEHE